MPIPTAGIVRIQSSSHKAPTMLLVTRAPCIRDILAMTAPICRSRHNLQSVRQPPRMHLMDQIPLRSKLTTKSATKRTHLQISTTIGTALSLSIYSSAIIPQDRQQTQSRQINSTMPSVLAVLPPVYCIKLVPTQMPAGIKRQAANSKSVAFRSLLNCLTLSPILRLRSVCPLMVPNLPRTLTSSTVWTMQNSASQLTTIVNSAVPNSLLDRHMMVVPTVKMMEHWVRLHP